MKMKFYVGTAFALALLTAGCASHAHILATDGGAYQAWFDASDRQRAEAVTSDSAADFCKERGGMALLVSRSTKYTGQMEEGTRSAIRQASDVASVLGAGYGTQHDSPLGQAGAAGHVMTSGKDYHSELVFKCSK